MVEREVPYYAYPGGPLVKYVRIDGPDEVMALYANEKAPTPVPPEPIITQLYLAKCPNPTCEWESDGELTEGEARASYDYHLKWVVHDDGL